MRYLILIVAGVVIVAVIVFSRKKTIKNDLKCEKKEQRNIQIDWKEIDRIKNFNFEILELNKLDHYVIFSEIEQMQNKYSELYFYLESIKHIGNRDIDEFLRQYNNLELIIDQINEKYVEKELMIHKNLLDDIDGKSLDHQQRMAVVRDEMNNLVIAGAGSGKTLTISGKVKYLVETKGYASDEILLISFTSASAKEMKERISDRLGLGVDVKTFHKLGFDIIKMVAEKEPDVSEKEMLSDLIHEYFSDVIYKNKKAISYLIDYFAYYIDVPKEVDEFDNLHDYHEYQMEQEYVTLRSKFEVESYIDENSNKMRKDKKTYNSERVRSIEEVVISNFLFLNGVEYQYESIYPHQSNNKYSKKYTPDFYLPKYDLYIEHFGINQDGRCPQYSLSEEKKYLNEMELKRETHKKNGTVLIETYSYYHSQGELIAKLQEKLEMHGVEYAPVDLRVVFERVFDHTEDRYMIKLTKLVSTFINLFKSRGFKTEKMKDLFYDETYSSKFLRARSILFFKIVKPVYDFYINKLNERNLIDFNDMINLATDIVKSGQVSLNYRYIIIDEYQDISYSRFQLINEIRKITNAKLLCVGDDWQSIYRFAGSDINLFTEFEYYFGKAKMSRIEKTYRNSQELIDIAGNFVMRNEKQIKKDLSSNKSVANPIKVYEFENQSSKLNDLVEEIAQGADENSSLLILGRNKSNKGIIDDSDMFTVKGSQIIYKQKLDLRISYMTVHASKGLEADNIILLNLRDHKLGFPNKLIDDPILLLVLTKLDPFIYAEERRLFYVALTRSRKKVYILTPKKEKSIFVKELAKTFEIPYIKDDGSEICEEIVQCPKCLVGQLVKRKSRFGHFVGCANYPKCDYKNNYIEILASKKRCPVCGDYLIRKRDNNKEILVCHRFHIKCCSYEEELCN